TDVALFYAATTPVQAWNSAARQVSAERGRTLSENARTFALLAMAMADGSIAVFDTKYTYNRWRPVTAIQNGDLDGNKKTTPDPPGPPLVAPPPFPSFASAHATVSGAARAVLERAFGENGHAITLTNPGLPGIVLNYTAWGQITDDIDDARIYGGIHFRFDQEAGARQGREVGRYILRHYLRSPDELDDFDDEGMGGVDDYRGGKRAPRATGRGGRPGDASRTKTAGGVLTAKQAPHRPGTAPVLPPRAGGDSGSSPSRSASPSLA